MRQLTTAATALLVLLLAHAAHAASLQPFRSEAQLSRAIDDWHARQARAQARRQRRYPPSIVAMSPPLPAPAAAAEANGMSLDSVQVTGSRASGAGEASITNVQTQGVDEGDIVKRHGDLLLVLRRGRLSTVRTGGDRLDVVASVDAFGPDVDPDGTWYDEMLVSDDTVAVIGYSYARGGTEVGVFDLDARGGLRYRATYQLRSGDYYSQRNYASRLVGHTLVFYSPLRLSPWGDWHAALPGLRRWRAGDAPSSFQRILPATRIYSGIDTLGEDGDATLHTVSACDLSRPVLHCSSTAVLGPSARVFYVSTDAVYVWTTEAANARGTAGASVFRLPLDGAAPTALRAWGSPVDPMAFLQRDGWLNVLVSRDGGGEGMSRSLRVKPGMALLRVPLKAFGDARASATADDYRLLPGTSGWDLHQRFVGDWLLYGDDREGRQQVHALRYAAGAPVQTFPLPHALERIEALGGDALLVGADGNDLVFSGLRLSGTHARLDGRYRRADAAQGDQRTHGFFYRPTDDDDGVLGLPILRGDDAAGSASVLYLRNRRLALSPLGTLDSHPTAGDDHCRASCYDWYGNARPIFLGDRVFALLGYELVEGRVDGATIRERRRVDFSPNARVAD